MKFNLVKLIIQATLVLVLSAIGIGAATAADNFCWRDSYGRGVGTIPKGCTGDKQDENGLCYSKCPAGMQGVGPVCWSQCPGGYTDMGAVCHISEPLTRNPEWVCKNHAPHWLGGGCIESVTRCPDGYSNAGLFCALSSRPTPAGFSGTYLDPVKNTHPRGAGTVPTLCGNGQQNDAGLCYTACRPGYNGVGPVCWGVPPSTGGKTWVACGMGSASDSTACANVVFDQVSSVGNMALNVATMGASVEAEKAVNGAEDAKKLSALKAAYADMKAGVAGAATKFQKELADAKAAAKEANVSEAEMQRFETMERYGELKKISGLTGTTKTCVDAALKATQAAPTGQPAADGSASLAVTSCLFNAGSKTPATAAQIASMDRLSKATKAASATASAAQAVPGSGEEAKFTAADYVRIAAQIAAMMDPTGALSTVAAYSYPKCSELFH